MIENEMKVKIFLKAFTITIWRLTISKKNTQVFFSRTKLEKERKQEF
jgi:hypothetical protein